MAPEIFHQVANLLNLEVDLLFFGTTSTCFELDEEDEPVPRDQDGNVTDDEQQAAEGKPAGFGAYGKSKDHRDDLPQAVIGMAVTRDGTPVRVWCWPGSTSDPALIRQVKDDMLSYHLLAGTRHDATAGSGRRVPPITTDGPGEWRQPASGHPPSDLVLTAALGRWGITAVASRSRP